MKKLLILISLLLLIPQTFAQTDEKPSNFREAKKQMVKIFSSLNNPATLYCGCRIIFTKNGGYRPDLQNCDYQISSDYERGKRIEAEHIVPVWEFAHKMNCWTQVLKGSGRDNCENTDEKFNLIEADLHNLYPAIGEVNKDRASNSFVENLRDKDNPDGYGKCEMFYNRAHHLSQPTERSRGIVARAYLYMNARYGLHLNHKQLRMYRSWNQKYKPTDDECKRNYIITKIQGNDNPFVTEKCELIVKHPHSVENTDTK